jgi:hypothetical protein
MARLARERWLAASPHLDRALEMADTDRGAAVITATVESNNVGTTCCR